MVAKQYQAFKKPLGTDYKASVFIALLNNTRFVQKVSGLTTVHEVDKA